MTLDRKDLKIQALLEKISSLTANYENQVAELRIDLTMMNDELEKAREAASVQETTDSDTSV